MPSPYRNGYRSSRQAKEPAIEPVIAHVQSQPIPLAASAPTPVLFPSYSVV